MKRRNFSTEFKHESVQLVVDQNYTVAQAAKAMALPEQGVSFCVASRWDAGLLADL